ncbi:histidine phosphatase family protein [Humitalea sp. 24SJ18S-53]|uniref:histidine phosphatase family protein n=1 Tax=Humitalea sp. 24SJ18S-53 TaxID=3422307 RepID=UPI003D6686B7
MTLMTRTLPHTPFWFLRHGETDWNAQYRAQGASDIALNAAGIAQAHRAAAVIAALPPERRPAHIVASPLSRARITAEVVGDALGLPVAIDEALRECSFGIQEGQVMAEWFHAWVAGDDTPEGCEPFVDLRARARGAIAAALANPAPVLVVAHGALWRGFRAEAGLPADFRTPNAQPLWVTPPSPGDTAWSLAALAMPDA